MGKPDAELIAACRAGDTAAFGQIVARYQRAVVAVAYAAVRDRVLAEDIAQDAFVTAWTRLAGLRDVERLPAWLCGIARNVARARRRTLRREEPGDVEIAGDATPYDALDDRETEVAVAAALARVPETYREPLVLFYCEQQSAGEVARALGVSDAAVHQRLSRGRALLAGDAKLVEHAPSRARRDLAAAVLAAIALGVGSSRVEASPRGKPMIKLAALALATTLAAGTTYVVAHGSTASTAAAPTAPSAGARTAHVAHLAHRPPAFHVPPAPVIFAEAVSAARASNTAPLLDCHTTALHMGRLALIGASALPDPSDPMMPEITEQAARMFDGRCASEAWSQEYMACLLGSSDLASSTFDCLSYAPVTSPDAAMPEGTIHFATRTDPIAPTTDTSCAGIAKHMVELSAPDPASVAALPADQRHMIEEGIARARQDMPAQIEQGCTDAGWTDARRACIAAATTSDAMGKCE